MLPKDYQGRTIAYSAAEVNANEAVHTWLN